MKLFNVITGGSNPANHFSLKFKKGGLLRTLFESIKLVLVVVVTVFFLLEYAIPFAQTSLGFEFPVKLPSLTKPSRDGDVKKVLNLATMIRMITDGKLSENKVLRYAGLICNASEKYEVNPLEIIAIIMAESCFKEGSINKDTGDYGLGQINWAHWGKDYGYTPQELLDPSVNIFLTCHVYKYFGKDFGKYHRGNGIQSNAYIVNVKSILSTLKAIAELNKQGIS